MKESIKKSKIIFSPDKGSFSLAFVVFIPFLVSVLFYICNYSEESSFFICTTSGLLVVIAFINAILASTYKIDVWEDTYTDI